MSNIDILAKLDQADEIFSLPQTLLEILQEVENDDWSAKSMAAIISRDPGLTARVLKMANSSFYSRGAEISTVNRAVLVLGASMVKCLALSVAIFNPVGEIKKKLDFDIRSLYTHYLSTAIGARQLAEKTGFAKTEEAFTAGLLHDIGMIYILKVAPAEYVDLLKQYEHGEDLVKLERELFDTDHAEVGYLISRKWKLPAGLQNAIGNHHRITSYDNFSSYEKLDQIVALANLINRHVFSSSGCYVEENIQQISNLLKSLDLDEDIITEINDRNLQETFKAAEHIGMEIGDPMTLLEKANRQIMRSYLTVESLFKERQELSKQIIEEEHKLGAMKSKNIAVATLSHYINNAATAISGRIQLMEMLLKNDKIIDKDGKLAPALEIIDASLTKILAVLAELKSLTSLDDVKFYKDSSTINIDENISQRLKTMKKVMG
ncbi:MAG: HDOD domain-containing protein [candidate division Zixibacteria bacterium]|nr:HDOD domain-containing protein [candidate division Zixibacteria bacterium]